MLSIFDAVFTIPRCLGNDYSSDAGCGCSTYRQHGLQREQLLRASPLSAVQVLPFLQDVLLPLEPGLAVAHPAENQEGRGRRRGSVAG